MVRSALQTSPISGVRLPAIRSPRTIEIVPDTYILGIESSCDETAAAVVRSGEELISNVVYSQIATHQPYGGVVPELASREHLRAIVPVVRKALEDAGKTYDTIDAIAVTQGPGLAGALLVGLSYAKALAFAADKPLIAVNHLEGHIHAVLLEERQNGNRELQFPVLALVVSGGHTHLYLAERRDSGWTYRNIGHTRDDAAGEAFDKVAKLLELGYPGGPSIDFLAQHGDPQAVKFPFAQIKHRDRNPQEPPLARRAPHRLLLQRHQDRRAALRGNSQHGGEHSAPSRTLCDDCQARQPRTTSPPAIARRSTWWHRSSARSWTISSARRWPRPIEYGVATLLVTGGVAANSELRATFAAPRRRRRHCGAVSLAQAFHRQRRHDRRRRLSAVSRRRICASRSVVRTRRSAW